MRRVFYVAIGIGLGVAVVRKLSKAATKLTPSGLASSAGESLAGVADSVRYFLDDVRSAMAQREAELRDALTGGAGAAGDHRMGGRS